MARDQNENSIQSRRKILLARRVELDVRLHKIEGELDAEHSKDTGELANEVEDNEVLEGMGQAGLLEIVKIDAALERIERGDYGVCASCGGDISAERLDVLPYTPMCKTCAANAETH
ncbi:MAG: RNA polymerase-binding transcription factor DksA [Celeribacter sp.]|jgi:RNA polymerase-binding transcription factor DksA